MSYLINRMKCGIPASLEEAILEVARGLEYELESRLKRFQKEQEKIGPVALLLLTYQTKQIQQTVRELLLTEAVSALLGGARREAAAMMAAAIEVVGFDGPISPSLPEEEIRRLRLLAAIVCPHQVAAHGAARTP